MKILVAVLLGLQVCCISHELIAGSGCSKSRRERERKEQVVQQAAAATGATKTELAEACERLAFLESQLRAREREKGEMVDAETISLVGTLEKRTQTDDVCSVLPISTGVQVGVESVDAAAETSINLVDACVGVDTGAAHGVDVSVQAGTERVDMCVQVEKEIGAPFVPVACAVCAEEIRAREDLVRLADFWKGVFPCDCFCHINCVLQKIVLPNGGGLQRVLAKRTNSFSAAISELDGVQRMNLKKAQNLTLFAYRLKSRGANIDPIALAQIVEDTCRYHEKESGKIRARAEALFRGIACAEADQQIGVGAASRFFKAVSAEKFELRPKIVCVDVASEAIPEKKYYEDAQTQVEKTEAILREAPDVDGGILVPIARMHEILAALRWHETQLSLLSFMTRHEKTHGFG